MIKSTTPASRRAPEGSERAGDDERDPAAMPNRSTSRLLKRPWLGRLAEVSTARPVGDRSGDPKPAWIHRAGKKQHGWCYREQESRPGECWELRLRNAVTNVDA